MKRTIRLSHKKFVPDLVEIINGDEGNEIFVLQGEVGARDNPAWDLYLLLFQPGAVPPGTGRQKFINPARSSGTGRSRNKLIGSVAGLHSFAESSTAL
jgi:hypothetical protein